MSDSVEWVVPTVADLKDYIASPAVVAFQTKALAADQSDPFDNSMHAVTNRIRSEIARHYVLSETPYSIPPDLMWVACLLIVEMMQGRLPGLRLNEGQQEQLRDARDYLKRINRGEVDIATPTDPDTDGGIQTPGSITVVASTTRVATREYLAGL